MPDFSAATQQADAQRLPVVEGFAIKVKAGADPEATARQATQLLAEHLGGAWESGEGHANWLSLYPVPRESPAPTLGPAWDAARALSLLPEIESAEPSLLIRTSDDADAAGTRSAAMNARLGADDSPFGLWGAPYRAQRQAEIATASKQSDWALNTLNVVTAWEKWKAQPQNVDKTPGEGIRVAHPDTGYTRHTQLQSALITNDGGQTYGYTFLDDGGKDALDPLSKDSLGNFPGHGTGTASVIVSPKGDVAPPEPDILGVAPGATLLPLRVSTSVIHLSFERLCRALETTIDENMHVVSMSLGGPASSERLVEIIDEAIDKGIIVCAAAGNYLPTVVFPAALPGVIGVSASNALNRAWHFTGFGEAVTITAPGEQVWHARSILDKDKEPAYSTIQGDGTSFAVAHVAGMAALWLSYHTREKLLGKYQDGDRSLLAYAFHRCLTASALSLPDLLPNPGFGAGLARADALLDTPLPDVDVVRGYREEILARRQGGLIGITLAGFVTLLRVPTLAEANAFAQDVPTTPTAPASVPPLSPAKALLQNILGGADATPTDVKELNALVSSNLRLKTVFSRALSNKNMAAVEMIPLRRYLLTLPLSQSLTARIAAAQKADVAAHPPLPADVIQARYENLHPKPRVRRLRAYGFDPSLAVRLDTAVVNEVTVNVPFENDLKPGPVGDYLEVVDVDPASNACYEPVDLNHPYLLAQDGLNWSEGNPQFHQQMTYAVAMKTIQHFEDALGRPLFWSSLRPWKHDSGDTDRAEKRLNARGEPDESDQFVQRLRLYPHALREANAYYSPQKRAILFGYFPAVNADARDTYPGGMVFACLSHDIIAHEMTHAVLDGMHAYFTEPTNPDVFAFHEGFADIIALFQHFTYSSVLQFELANTRGDLNTDSLLANLALQFGLARGASPGASFRPGSAGRAKANEQSGGMGRRRPRRSGRRGRQDP